MHSRKRGKSGSTKPISDTVPSWVNYKSEEVKFIIAKLSKQGLSSSQIGIVLRDSYGIPDVKKLTKKRITEILAAKKLTSDIPEDLKNLLKKAIRIKEHRDSNKKDNTSKRGLQLTEAKIRRLVNYYKKKGKLPKDWKYDIKRAKLLVY